MCKEKGKCCKLIIYNGSIHNLVSKEMVDKMGLKKITKPTPYRVSWMQKGHQVLVNEQFQVEFRIGTYSDRVLCVVMRMDACHVLLERPLQFDRNVVYDGRVNNITFVKGGIRNTLHPLKDEKPKEQVSPRVMLVGVKEFMHQLKETKVNYVVIGKTNIVLTNTRFDDLPIEVQDVLNEKVDIMVDDFLNELPPVRSIGHHIDLIIRTSFPNKAAYRMTLRESEEI